MGKTEKVKGVGGKGGRGKKDGLGWVGRVVGGGWRG